MVAATMEALTRDEATKQKRRTTARASMQPKKRRAAAASAPDAVPNQIQRTFEFQHTVDLASTAASNHRSSVDLHTAGRRRARRGRRHPRTPTCSGQSSHEQRSLAGWRRSSVP